MKKIIIDRFEGIYAICEDADKKFFAIETGELPKGVKEGTVLAITEEGELQVDQAETDARREKLHDKQRRLFR